MENPLVSILDMFSCPNYRYMIDFINGLGYIIEQGLDSQCLMLLAFLSTNYGSIELFKLCMCFETADCAVFDELVEDLTWKVAK